MSEVLEVLMVHFYPMENAITHKTDKYELVHEEIPTPVLRRGLKFSMVIRFKGRKYQKERDVVRLVFNFGLNPNPIKGTKGIIRLDPRNQPVGTNKKRWSGAILAEGPDSLTIEVYSPADCPVGNWKVQVETYVLNSSLKPNIFDYESEVYLLFNPWNCDDLVCMPTKRLLDEYVMEDIGKIWVGPYGSSRGREWVFGQFDKAVLPAAMLMLYRSGMADASRGDPIRVARSISKLVNSNDDDGVLQGRWDGEYGDGTAPSAWTGSIAILEQFLETEQPVCYGQCWVFSGVVTSIARALGIPSRVVSNLVSAHDANASLTVDKYYDALNEELEFDPNNPNGEDSIWNYHVWCDVWMARPDLPAGHGGWQAIDATPQETSDGVYQCGPASLEAIRTGQVGYNYDVAFMIASVNADLMRWKEDPESPMGFSRIYCNKYHIGRLILTKQPFLYDPNGDKDREDITIQYKPKEGSEAERLTLLNAVRCTQTARSFYSVPETIKEDVLFDLIELERIKIGDNYEVKVVIKNNSSEIRNIKAVLATASIFYTGVKAKVIKRAEGSFTMKPNSEETMSLLVTANDYLEKLVEYCIMKIYAIATVEETKQTWAEEDDFQVIKPNIEIKVPKAIPIKRPTRVTLQFNNPLKKVLTKCELHLAGPTMMRNQILTHPDVQPGGLIQAHTQITPKLAGDQTIVATFSSKELGDISGSIKIDVFDDGE